MAFRWTVECACTGLALVLLLVVPASAQNELTKLVPGDGEAGDSFGCSVSLSGGMVLVGAPGDDDHGSGSGSAYVFIATTGQQLHKLAPQDGCASAVFGSAVSLSERQALIGAPGDDDNGIGSGSAYIFDAATGLQLQKLLPSDGEYGDVFGHSVSLSDGLALVGAPGDYNNADGYGGAAYVFDASTGQLLRKLMPSDGYDCDEFGVSVSVSDGLALVGSTFLHFAYLFDVASGAQLFKLVAADGGGGHSFGYSVSLSGGLALVGTPYDDDHGQGSGSVYVFDIHSGQQLLKLTPQDGEAGDIFGCSVSLSHDVPLVGAFMKEDNGPASGAAYAFGPFPSQQVTKLLPQDGGPQDKFGQAVSLSGTLALIGAPHDDENGDNSGSAYVFAAIHDCNGNVVPDHIDIATGTSTDCNDNGTPDECDILQGVSPDCNANGVPDECDVAENTSPDCNINGVPDECDLAQGASPDCNSNGIPDECDLDGNDCDSNGVPDECDPDENDNGIPDACDCVGANHCLAAANSNGTAARIGSNGLTSLSHNCFVLTVEEAMPTQFGLFFYSANQQQVFWGEGMLCVGPGLQRIFPIVLTDSYGGAALQLDFTMPSFISGPFAIDPFSTWNFQYWYRDPLGGPAGFNSSNGLEVTFCP